MTSFGLVYLFLGALDFQVEVLLSSIISLVLACHEWLYGRMRRLVFILPSLG